MCKAFKPLKSPALLVPFLALSLIQGQRLKSVLATVFAKSVLDQATGNSAGYIMAGQVTQL